MCEPQRLLSHPLNSPSSSLEEALPPYIYLIMINGVNVHEIIIILNVMHTRCIQLGILTLDTMISSTTQYRKITSSQLEVCWWNDCLFGQPQCWLDPLSNSTRTGLSCRPRQCWSTWPVRAGGVIITTPNTSSLDNPYLHVWVSHWSESTLI